MKDKKNCVDRFIANRLDKRLMELMNVRLDIRHRAIPRFDSIDYFNSSLYEQDFSDIRKLRDIAIEMTNDCNKFLERISDQYSKLN